MQFAVWQLRSVKSSNNTPTDLLRVIFIFTAIHLREWLHIPSRKGYSMRMSERIPREFIQELLSRIDIVELIDGRMPLQKKSGNNYFACCPFHTEKSASFSVSQNKQFFHCFGCGAHGNSIDFLMQYDRLSFPEAVEALAKLAGIPVPRDTSPKNNEKQPATDLYVLMEEVTHFYQRLLRTAPVAINYLKKRGLTGAIAKEFSIGYTPAGWETLTRALGKTPEKCQLLHEAGMLIKKEDGRYYDRFRERILFPIRDRRGRTIGFGGRILETGEPKYLNSPETPLFHKGQELYGLYHAQKANRQLPRVVIVEGYMDVIALFQHGITYAVATLGTATTASHLTRLFRYTSEIVFCFDGDTAGRTAAFRALQTALPLMQDGRQIRFMFLPDGEDPDTLIRKTSQTHFATLIDTAPSLSQFFFQWLATEANPTNLDGRARFASLAMEHIQSIPEGIFRQMMLDELAKRTHMNPTQLTQTKNTPPPLSKNSTTQQNTQRASPLHLVIMLLIQQPYLVQHIQAPLPNTDTRGLNLLRTLVAYIQKKPTMTTGELLERFREQPEEKLLAKLACKPHMIPTAGIEKEFLGALEKLHIAEKKRLIDTLLARASANTLTITEKQQLSSLIQQKTDYAAKQKNPDDLSSDNLIK